MKNILLGTAGHVDHGKTALIKALTGVDTDRLKEEKERGITIELGFTALTLPHGQRIGIVDVPGHERFVKNMVAGAGGIDMVLLVIAADEGVMPQTREHLDICTLLGVKEGLVALTKVDLVDDEWLSLVREDVREFLRGTFLHDAPIVPVSTVANKGLAELVSAIEERAFRVEESADTGIFRLPIDRVFTMKGFGTVVTGTVMSGKVKTGEAVEVYPGRKKARVRGLQVHNATVEEAASGQRTAVNIQGVDRDAIERGNVLGHPYTLEPSARLDVFFEYLPSAPRHLKSRTLVRFHAGTNETIARIILLDRDDIGPGDKCFAQVVPESPVIAMARDRFVVRSYSPVRTVGGGEVLDPLPRKHKRNHPDVLKEMGALLDGSEYERTAHIIRRAGLQGITIPSLSVRTGISPSGIEKILQEMYSRQEAVLWDRETQRVVSFPLYSKLQEKVVAKTGSYHERFPLRAGISKEELRMTVGGFIDPKLFNKALLDLEKAGKLTVEKESVRLPTHRVNLQGGLAEARNEIGEICLQAGLAPPTGKEILERMAGRFPDADKVLEVMLNDGILVKVGDDLYFHRDTVGKLREDYRHLLLKEGKSTPSSFKDLTGLSRKFIIPLMEYFDTTKLTIRVGGHRVLRDRQGK